MKRLLLIMFVLSLSLFGQSQGNRFEKMFQDLERKGDSIWRIEKKRINHELMNRALDITFSSDDSVRTTKDFILMLCWASYLEGGGYMKGNPDFDYKGLVDCMVRNQVEVNRIDYWNKFWKDYYENKRWRRRK